MFAWILNNAVTVITITVLLLIIGIAVFSLLNDKKHKSGGCTGNCSSCGMNCSSGKKEP